jgi:uncharacterized protein with von Willebrand factor type A (vWA) domain
VSEAPVAGHIGAISENVVLFGRILRQAGLAVEPGQTRLFLDALSRIGVARKRDVHAAGRAIYTRRHEERALFDAAFDLFWRRQGPGAIESLPRLAERLRPEGRAEFGVPVEAARSPATTVRPSDVRAPSTADALRQADFATLSGAEARDALRLVDALRVMLPRRPSRRPIVGRRGARLAPRAMLRRSIATGGEVLTWRWRRSVTRPRPVVLICDISGSMERYSRLLLRFAHCLQRSGAPLEVFVFGTRLTRITRQLRVRSGDDAIRRVASHVVDWSGGTRIGESLHQLSRRWVRRTVRSSAIVLLASDGWERGDAALLGREMAILRRSCHRLYWLDPLASRPGFEPATAGLQAALPFVDALVPCASVASLEELGKVFGRYGLTGVRTFGPSESAHGGAERRNA